MTRNLVLHALAALALWALWRGWQDVRIDRRDRCVEAAADLCNQPQWGAFENVLDNTDWAREGEAS